MGAFIRVALVPTPNVPEGTEVLVGVDQISSVEPLISNTGQSIIKLAVPQTMRDEKGESSVVPASYVVVHSLAEIQKMISEAIRMQFS